MKQMKCPKCRKEIDKVCIVSKCWQYGYLGPLNLKLTKPKCHITSYGGVEEIFETISITCPECDEDISECIEE